MWARGELFSQEDSDEEREAIKEALAAFGVVAEEPISPVDNDPPFYLWPENEECYRLFCSLQTQWRIGFHGATGLDYASVLAHLERGVRLPRRKRRELYSLIVPHMEHGALRGWREVKEES